MHRGASLTRQAATGEYRVGILVSANQHTRTDREVQVMQHSACGSVVITCKLLIKVKDN
jgi:hypothetical protein